MASIRRSRDEAIGRDTEDNHKDFSLGADDKEEDDIDGDVGDMCLGTGVRKHKRMCLVTGGDGRVIPVQTWCSMPLLRTEVPNISQSKTTHNPDIQSLRKINSLDCVFMSESNVVPISVTQSADIGNRKPLCNLLVLSIGWMLFFMSFSSIRNIQSSINHEGGLGLYSMAGVYGGYMAACCFTTVIVKKFSPKWTLVVGMVSQIVYTLTIMYPKLHVILPVSVIGGFMQCAMWTAQATLIVDVSFRVPNTGTKCREALISKHFGVFYGFASFSPIIGSIIMSLLMTSAWNENVATGNGPTSPIDPSANISTSSHYNGSNTVAGYILETPPLQPSREIVPTHPQGSLALVPKSKMEDNDETYINISKEEYAVKNVKSVVINNTSGNNSENSGGCGKKFCQEDMSDEEKAQLDVSTFTRNVFSGTLAVCMLLALGSFAVFLDGRRMLSQTEECVREQLIVMFRLLKTKHFLLLSPLIFYHGVQTAFFSGEVTKVRSKELH